MWSGYTLKTALCIVIRFSQSAVILLCNLQQDPAIIKPFKDEHNWLQHSRVLHTPFSFQDTKYHQYIFSSTIPSKRHGEWTYSHIKTRHKIKKPWPAALPGIAVCINRICNGMFGQGLWYMSIAIFYQLIWFLTICI